MSATLDGARLTNSRLLARNVGLNALGWLLPMLLALGAIPVLVRTLGTDRFGVLSLVWTLVAERLGREQREDLPGLVWTATWLLVPLGLVGGAAVALLAPWLVERVLRVSAPLQAESITAFRWIGFAVPFTVSTAGFRGVLEAVQAFRRINALRVPLALITFVGPLAVLPFSRALPASVAVLALGRAALWAAHVWSARQAFEPLRRVRAPERRHLRPLLAVGGWMTVSNVVSPLMYSLDRFAVAAVLSVAAVSYYATAYEAVTRLWVVTSVLLPVLFPALGVAFQRDRVHAARLLDRGSRVALGAVFPAALALAAFAPEWLTVWLGADFGANAAVLAQGLAAAVFVNVAGQMAYTVLQASGRADVTGRLHLLELVPYLAALWALLRGAGTTGVVIAWGLRVLVDTAVLLRVAARVQPDCAEALRRLAWRTAVGAPLVLAPAWIPGVWARAGYAGAVLACYAVYVATRLIAAEERAILRQSARRLRGERAPQPVGDAV